MCFHQFLVFLELSSPGISPGRVQALGLADPPTPRLSRSDLLIVMATLPSVFHLLYPGFTTMPEICECFIHYKHACHVLVEKLGLGQNDTHNWALQALFADATDAESSNSAHWPDLTQNHYRGFVGQLNSSCTLKHGQQANQTMIWPNTATGVKEIDSLVLSGLSYTPRSLILKFQWLDDSQNQYSDGSEGSEEPDKGLDLQVSVRICIGRWRCSEISGRYHGLHTPHHSSLHMNSGITLWKSTRKQEQRLYWLWSSEMLSSLSFLKYSTDSSSVGVSLGSLILETVLSTTLMILWRPHANGLRSKSSLWSANHMWMMEKLGLATTRLAEVIMWSRQFKSGMRSSVVLELIVSKKYFSRQVYLIHGSQRFSAQ